MALTVPASQLAGAAATPPVNGASGAASAQASYPNNYTITPSLTPTAYGAPFFSTTLFAGIQARPALKQDTVQFGAASGGDDSLGLYLAQIGQ